MSVLYMKKYHLERKIHMKKIFISTILSLTLILLSGCGSKIGVESPYGSNVNQLEGVSIELNKESYMTEGDVFELTTTNQSEEEVTYGVAYTIEYLNDDTWHIVEPNEEISFILIAQILGPGEEALETISMEYYEPLKSGQYRLIREINNKVLAAEFSVLEE